jgi:hypothetical protein
LQNLEEMDKFLDTYDHPNWTKRILTTYKDLKHVMKLSLPKKKWPGTDRFSAEFY